MGGGEIKPDTMWQNQAVAQKGLFCHDDDLQFISTFTGHLTPSIVLHAVQAGLDDS
jgi:hypothetical protein